MYTCITCFRFLKINCPKNKLIYMRSIILFVEQLWFTQAGKRLQHGRRVRSRGTTSGGGRTSLSSDVTASCTPGPFKQRHCHSLRKQRLAFSSLWHKGRCDDVDVGAVHHNLICGLCDLSVSKKVELFASHIFFFKDSDTR